MALSVFPPVETGGGVVWETDAKEESNSEGVEGTVVEIVWPAVVDPVAPGEVSAEETGAVTLESVSGHQVV